MNPECRPISLTRPTPLGEALASTWAARIDLVASAERGLKAEALIDEHDVVVDRLGNADDGDLRRRARRSPRVICIAPAERAVAADDEQHVDAHLFQAIDDLGGVLLAARGAQDRAAMLVDVADDASGSGRAPARPYLAMKPW